MRIANLAELGGYDSIYLSPLEGDVAVSCAGRVASERERGLGVLVVTLFGPLSDSGTRDVHQFAAGLPEAPRRHPEHAALRSAFYGRSPEDDGCVAGAARLLDEIGRRTRAQHVYVPLGVGGHIDHRLCYEAALRAFESGAGRNVFLYEEQPYASLPVAVRIRLGQLGARLPPAATGVPGRRGLSRFLLGVHLARHAPADFKGRIERLRCAGLAVRQWRETRGWRPQKAFGPRLQPVIHRTASGVERYWLLLPARAEGGMAILPTAS